MFRSRRVEEMAKELEALKNQSKEDVAHRLTESPSMPESAQDSPDHPSEHLGTAVLDVTGITQDHFQLEDFIIDKDLVIDIYKILAKHVGVFSPIRGSVDLAVIEHFVRSFPVPPEFAYRVMVHHTISKFFNAIVENSQEAMSQSMVSIIDAELDDLKARYPTPWTPRVEVSNLTAKLLLYTTVIIRLHADRVSREILMRKGLSAAVRIVYLMKQGLAYQSKDFPDIPPETLQSTLPKNYFRILILSTTFLLRFFVLNNHASPEEQELARNHVAIAQRFLNAASDDPLDERVRAATLLEVLSRQKPIDLDHFKLRVDDRMSASLVIDAVTTGHELRNLPTEIDESSPNTSANGLPKPPPQSVDINGQDLPMDDSLMYDSNTFDFSLPEDLWGDSIWGMFNNMAPSAYPPYTASDFIQGPLGYNFTYN
ncbi:hypothetical protein N0V83_007639 [Neocucurbitaria cava]|uniref:Uncharacterized protein n=1 Tax=Neocucurbitaria cava TaxID=798079 RepID=A0A9W8Y696_9PLEO|nr:hypothetical protein N0V83_007639 [Neocucurbitaria cava]